MVLSFVFADARSLVVMKPEELAVVAGIDHSVTNAFFEAFCCPPEAFNEEHHAYPFGAHPLTERPVLRVSEGFIVPVPQTMLDAVRPRMEDLLAEQPGVWDRYAKARGSFLERETSELLRGALPGSKAWTGVKWASKEANSDLDALVHADDVALRVQCKAGRMTAPARRGAPERMREELGELLTEAAQQHRRLDEEIVAEGSAALGFTHAQQQALAAPLQLEVIVTLEAMTVWATHAHELRGLGVLPGDRQVPWVLSIMDLMAVTDLLEGANLVHYLARRQRLERDGRIYAHDELDWVGHYLTEGLFFDAYFEGEDPPNRFRLLSYTDPIDSWYLKRAGVRSVDTPKPSQDVPLLLAGLLSRLARERPRHWVLAAIALLDGDDASWQRWADAVNNISQRLSAEGWSNATRVFTGRFGVTLYVDHRIAYPRLRKIAIEYARKKMEECDEHNWILIGEGADSALFVVIQHDRGLPILTDAFLEPAGNRPSDARGR